MENKPKVLVFDIETFPMEVRIWQLGEQRINISQIVKDWSVAAWAAKWLGDSPSKVIYDDVSGNRNIREDKNILYPLWHLLNSADIAITQNGERFDSRKLNARFIQHGFGPPKPYKHLDTYKIAKKVAEFTSHKLEYLTGKLNVKYKKLLHKNFPGQTLWDQCLEGNKKAWAEMKRYNIHDVLATEELYNILKAWAPETAPKPFANERGLCGVCGKTGLIKKGLLRNKSGFYQRYHCIQCSSWSKGGKIK